MSDNRVMASLAQSLVAHPGRFRILSALIQRNRQEFVELRRVTGMTDGNLACHARRLDAARLIGIEKRFREGKPVTTYALTGAGRAAIESHVRDLVEAVHSPSPLPAHPSEADDWID